MKFKSILKILALCGAAGIHFGCATAEPVATTQPASRTAAEVPRGAVVFDNDLLRVTKEREGSGLAAVGVEAVHRIMVRAKQPIANVMIEEHFPSSIDYVSSTPSGTQDGSRVTWDLGQMAEGESKVIRVRSIPKERGSFSVCSVVSADPLICLPVQVGAPDLQIVKSGPSSVEVNETVNWSVTVTNTGDSTARNVVIQDELPDGFTAGSPVRFEVGTLEPGQSRVVEVSARSETTGSFTNRATAVHDGADEVAATAPIRVVESGIDVEITGPEQSYALVDETFRVITRNTGDTALESTQTVLRLPANVRVSDTGGGTAAAATADRPATITWNIGNLDTGASRAYDVVMTATRPGSTVKNVSATAARGLEASDRHETEWRAVPGIQTTIVDDVDPIRVGDRVVYTMRVANQSPLETIEANIRVRFPAEVRPVRIGDGPVSGTVSDRVVNFETLNISPRQEVVLTIIAEGARSGNGTVVMETTTGFRDTPIVDQESTTVY